MTISPSQTPIPNRLNVAIIAAQLLTVGACFYAAREVSSGWMLALVCAGFAIVMNSVYAIIHEAEHAMLFANRRWNDWAGIVLALLFPAPFHLIRQGHLGHHLRNRSDDEAFDFYFEGDHKLWKVLVLYGIITGFYYVVVVLSNVVFLFVPVCADKRYWRIDQATTAFIEALNPRYRLAIRLEGIAAIALHVAIVCGLGVPLGHYLALYAAFGFTWSAMQYVHHYGTERHVTRGARNLWFWKPIDLLWLNHNWHLTHHENPGLPWLYLPEKSAEAPTKRGFLVTAYLRMWRGPTRADASVKNPHAGRVIP